MTGQSEVDAGLDRVWQAVGSLAPFVVAVLAALVVVVVMAYRLLHRRRITSLKTYRAPAPTVRHMGGQR